MNGIPVWVWCALVLSVLYAAASLVVLSLSFGWRQQVVELRQQVEQAELARPYLVASAEQHLDHADELVQGAIALNRQLLETIIRTVSELLMGRLVSLLLPARWRRLGATMTRQAARQGAAALAPMFLDAPGGAEPPNGPRASGIMGTHPNRNRRES